MNRADADRLTALLVEVQNLAVNARAAIRSQHDERRAEEDRRTDVDVAVWLRELAARGERLTERINDVIVGASRAGVL